MLLVPKNCLGLFPPVLIAELNELEGQVFRVPHDQDAEG